MILEFVPPTEVGSTVKIVNMSQLPVEKIAAMSNSQLYMEIIVF